MPPTTTEIRNAILLEEYRIPSITAYNRLEASPRTGDFARSLKAEIRDPLWMLTRQWQFGEFQGEDAASPVTSRIAYQHHPMDRVALAQGAPALLGVENMPLETYVEREPLPLIVREMANGDIYSDVVF